MSFKIKIDVFTLLEISELNKLYALWQLVILINNGSKAPDVILSTILNEDRRGSCDGNDFNKTREFWISAVLSTFALPYSA